MNILLYYNHFVEVEWIFANLVEKIGDAYFSNFTVLPVNPGMWAGQLMRDLCRNFTILKSSHFCPCHQITSSYSITIDLISIHNVIPCSTSHFSLMQHPKKKKYRNLPTKSKSWLKAVSHPNDVGKCKILNIPCAGGADCSTVQMKSHIRLNSISLDVTILPFFVWNSEQVQ